MLNSKNKTSQTKPVQVLLTDAHKRKKAVPFTLNSVDLTGLLIEAIQLAKLISTEERDLELIRNDYKLKSRILEMQHEQIVTAIKEEYRERREIVAGINQRAEQLIAAEQFEAGKEIMNRMMDLISNNSPLRNVMEYRNNPLLE